MSTVRKLSYRSDLGELRRISRDVSAYCHEHAIDPDTALALTLCLNELFTNTLKYGYCAASPTGAAGGRADSETRRTPDRVTDTRLDGMGGGKADIAEQLVEAITNFFVEINLERHENRVLVRYCDRGQPFDPFINPQPLPDMQATEPETLLTGGFGIHLLRRLCSDARYAREGENNVISLTFVWDE